MAREPSARRSAPADPTDWFVAAVDRVHVSADTVREEVLAAVAALESGRRARMEGAPISAIVDQLIGGGGRNTRLAAHDAFLDFERSIQVMRASVVRALVEDEGFSLTEAARSLRISRQAAARLHDAAAELADLRPDKQVT